MGVAVNVGEKPSTGKALRRRLLVFECLRKWHAKIRNFLIEMVELEIHET